MVERHYPWPWISFSSLYSFWTCPQRWFYHYVERFPEEPTTAMRRGTICHDAFFEFFDAYTPNKIVTLAQTANPADGIKASEPYHSFYNTLKTLVPVDEPLMEDAEERNNILHSLRGFALMEASLLFEMASKHNKITVDTVNEEWFPHAREEIHADDDAKLYGKIDRIDRRDGKYVLLDYKVRGSKNPRKSGLSKAEKWQSTIYMYLFRKENMIAGGDMEFYFVYPNTRGEPYLGSKQWSKVAERWLMRRVDKQREMVENNDFYRIVERKPTIRKGYVPQKKSSLTFVKKHVCLYCPYCERCLGENPIEMDDRLKRIMRAYKDV